MIIRQANSSDLAEMQKLFANTVSSVCKADYNDDQIRVWASSVENKKRWEDILKNQLVLLALDKTKITGFCTLDKGNYIDFLYVHKDYQRKGIARKLYLLIEKEAKQLKQTQLTSDVSKTARSFFESIGFTVIKEQTFKKSGVEMTNFKMKKELT